MRNRKEIKALLDHCVDQRKIVPKISGIGTFNWDELDEQVDLLYKVLNTGKVPKLDQYNEPITDSIALWVLELNTTYDLLLEELM